MYFSVLQCIVVYCSVVWCNAVQFNNVLQSACSEHYVWSHLKHLTQKVSADRSTLQNHIWTIQWTHKCSEVCKSVNGNVRHDQSIFSELTSKNGIMLTIPCSWGYDDLTSQSQVATFCPNVQNGLFSKKAIPKPIKSGHHTTTCLT